MALMETEYLKVSVKGNLAYFGEARNIDYRHMVPLPRSTRLTGGKRSLPLGR